MSVALKLRQAEAKDVSAIRELTREAYAKWVPVIGREPKPMTADYAEAVRSHRIDLLYVDGKLAALIETIPGAGHLLIALNIEVFQPLATFSTGIEAMIAGLKGTKLAKGSDEIFYPGEIEARNDIRNRADGLVLPADTMRDLAKLAADMQATHLLPF